ncbi:hypothetical protein B0H17DRAFT_1140817 [Mycena rosella]|uniref:Uncharacterized protein n=1 Tax=Mycena rosella TaxID=1033263 RepID=A0AAD7D113_MYCRO|nr:hypothetical protein B0H17DRAFT_1140817 [Mycena rosella]
MGEGFPAKPVNFIDKNLRYFLVHREPRGPVSIFSFARLIAGVHAVILLLLASYSHAKRRTASTPPSTIKGLAASALWRAPSSMNLKNGNGSSADWVSNLKLLVAALKTTSTWVPMTCLQLPWQYFWMQ